ncbi:unnamed protein product [Sordaria macrospora k-hell]|uniref:WGS project CABT00000000 data, contig 2.96 n=1 Tax=Sordaria macrospora (strain ATCC MYA-333 / DSM 997 / K(L3346) / K-hell) TaxID=771870 RepID=F7WC54_SORMK|nr:uncharacterized protein SMAC_09512 [Sordaria macrospora k-hell]CCC05548.1 unnamed protein product [Sordaria macrospora k-hell]
MPVNNRAMVPPDLARFVRSRSATIQPIDHIQVPKHPQPIESSLTCPAVGLEAPDLVVTTILKSPFPPIPHAPELAPSFFHSFPCVTVQELRLSMAVPLESFREKPMSMMEMDDEAAIACHHSSLYTPSPGSTAMAMGAERRQACSSTTTTLIHTTRQSLCTLKPYATADAPVPLLV